MPRIALNTEQKKEYKLKDFKAWIHKQMKLNGMNQSDLGKVLGVSQVRVSQMLQISDSKNKKKRKNKINPDPFSYGDLLILIDLFGADEKEKSGFLTL